MFIYYIGIINMYLWVFVLVLWLTRCNSKEAGFFLLIVGSGLFGRFIPSPFLNILFTVLLISIGIILLRKEILFALKNHSHSLLFLLLLLSFFFIEYYIGPRNDYAHEKIMKASVRLILWTISFLIFVDSTKISSKHIGLAFLILAVFYLSLCGQLYGIRPSSIFDTNFFRDYTMLMGRDENQVHVANYHTLAYLSLAGTVFYTLQKGFYTKEIKKNTILLFVISFWIIAISGARQGMFVFGISMVLRYLVTRKRMFSFANIASILMFVLFFITIVSLLGSSYYEAALDSEGDARSRLNRDTLTPFVVMAIDPIWGVGFGGYPEYANKDYPHNFFLEMICEYGFFGFLILCILFVCYFISNKNKSYLKYMTVNNSYLFVLFLLFFSRAQISGDITASVSFMAILLAFVNNSKQIKRHVQI